jgi:hypothetical protein
MKEVTTHRPEAQCDGLRIGVRTALLPILKTELSELAQSFASGNDAPER